MEVAIDVRPIVVTPGVDCRVDSTLNDNVWSDEDALSEDEGVMVGGVSSEEVTGSESEA